MIPRVYGLFSVQAATCPISVIGKNGNYKKEYTKKYKHSEKNHLLPSEYHLDKLLSGCAHDFASKEFSNS